MGEAKRRRAAQTEIPPEHRADIARVVRSVDLEIGSGTCRFRAMMGHVALRCLGLGSRITVGGMVYRAGPDAVTDTLAFLGEANGAVHYWLETVDTLIDFSAGDWRSLDEAGYYGVKQVQNWTTSPPDFWWLSKAQVSNSLDIRVVGAMAYERIPGYPDDTDEYFEKPPVQWLGGILQDRMKTLRTDWQSGNRTEFVKKTVILSKPLARNGRDLNATVARISGGEPVPRINEGDFR
jgi:hypothetical protein